MAIERDIEQQREIIEYWIGNEPLTENELKERSKRWYAGEPSVDDEIGQRFGDLFELACSERLIHWAESSNGALALVLLLDQFSRNLFRGTHQAFTQDPLARAIAVRTIKNGLYSELFTLGRIFMLHPLHHSEERLDQDLAVREIGQLLRDADLDHYDYIVKSLDFFVSHRDIILRFHRFPHRNRLLNRESTTEELDYLKTAATYGQ